MRFLKQQNLNKFRRTDRTIYYDEFGNVEMRTSRSLLIPKGDNINKPTLPENGQIRYNTDIADVEIYVNGQWRLLRYKEPVEIIQQTVGYGDYVNQTFGPLSPIPASGQSIIVLIENVVQIHGMNYTLQQIGPDYYLYFDQPPPTKPITVLHNFDR